MTAIPKLSVADPTLEAGNDYGAECEDAPAVDPRCIHFVDLCDVLHQNKPRSPIPTGLAALDEHTSGGLSRGESAILGSGPGGLKTTIMTNLVASMSGPNTATCIIAFDEQWTRVAQKIGARFGASYNALTSEHPDAIEDLREVLTRRDAFVHMVDPVSALPIEHVAETFDRIAPPGRVRLYFVDLLQLMTSLACEDSDTEQAELRKIVEALMKILKTQEAIVVALSESTKAQISLEAVEANPLGVFAGTRKIASRFDVPIALAKVDDTTAKVFVRKNRLGRTGDFLVKLNPETWRIETISDGEVAARKDAASSERQKVLARAVVRAIAALPGGVSGRKLIGHLRGVERVPFRAVDLSAALAFLTDLGALVADDGPRHSELWKFASGVTLETALGVLS